MTGAQQRCPRCAADVPSMQRFCGSCGSPVVPSSEIGTVAMPEAASAAFRSSSPDDGRFPPGVILGQRYRIGRRLGKGGMGEVYQAFDMKLGQAVALKFLPERLASEGASERLSNEVRLARQVSHPNVCRVYDIGEIEGMPFLSMEYVDGEDLASLLRRIGRLPSDKALDIARRLCAGLAAAHDKGVLHRDLKPANIMIDGRGEVLITDFGLAALSGNIQAAEVRQGTPAYMSPEQLAGTGVTVKSDLYALGLVLYEVFTGKRAYEAGSAEELLRMQRESAPVTLTTVAKEVDPAVERVIQRCLAADPRQRPASAKAVALALPGGDPLEAAVAAGETPSPEMVANAGETEGLRPAVAISLFAAIVLIWVGLPALQLISPLSASMIDHIPFPNSPEALAALARERAGQLGYTKRPADSAYGLDYNGGWLKELREHYPARSGPSLLAGGRPAAITFWYRESPEPMDPGSNPSVTMRLPPFATPGMLRMRLDTQGRLLEFEAVPAYLDPEPKTAAMPDWDPLFASAGLERAAFTPAAPEWTPAMACDSHAAWIGSWPEARNIAIRVEAAAWHGKPVSFRVIETWAAPGRAFEGGFANPENSFIGDILFTFVLAPTAIIFARRNVKLNRADTAAAWRLALILFAASIAGNLLAYSHVAGPGELGRLGQILAAAVFTAAFVGAMYLALEPYIRRRWPHALVSWRRLVEGRMRDPLVGTHVLAGAAAASAIAVFFIIGSVAQASRGRLVTDFLDPLLGPRMFAGRLLWTSGDLPFCLGMFFLFFLLRVLLRRDWLAGTAFVLIMVLGFSPLRDASAIRIGMGAIMFSGLLITLRKFGILAGFTTMLMISWQMVPLTLDPARWDFPYSLATILLVVGVAAYGCWASLRGRPLWKEEM